MKLQNVALTNNHVCWKLPELDVGFYHKEEAGVYLTARGTPLKVRKGDALTLRLADGTMVADFVVTAPHVAEDGKVDGWSLASGTLAYRALRDLGDGPCDIVGNDIQEGCDRCGYGFHEHPEPHWSTP